MESKEIVVKACKKARLGIGFKSFLPDALFLSHIVLCKVRLQAAFGIDTVLVSILYVLFPVWTIAPALYFSVGNLA